MALFTFEPLPLKNSLYVLEAQQKCTYCLPPDDVIFPAVLKNWIYPS